MIDIKELRIGNLVSYDGRVFEIDTIAKEFPTLNTIEFGIGVVDWMNINPIPLTEEWLIKFGFEKDDVFDEFFTYLPIHDLCMDKLSFRVDEGFICYESIKYRTLLKHIQYVHSLQNLYFALTNQELEIKK